MNRSSRCFLAALAAAVVVTAPAVAQDVRVDRLEMALAAPARSDEDKARDATRHPIEVMQFLGVSDGDNVLELVAAGGWYTQVLSAAVGENGQVYAQNPDRLVGRPGFADREAALHERLGNVTAVHGEVADAGIGGQMDIAFTALNLHDMANRGDAAALALLRGAFGALRSGGVLGVIDHQGMAGQPNADLHRMPQSEAQRLLEEAGFTVEATSDVLANPEDDHTLGIREDAIRGKTDRFLIRARKP